MDTNNGVSIDRRTGLEELDREECLKLLARAPLGRLGVVVGGRPLVFPVNFTLDRAAVVLRTDEGTKLYAARNGPVAFECDGIDRIYHTGWSVLVLGDAEEVHDPHQIARLERLPLSGWSRGPKPTWLRIGGTITGRRIPSHSRMQTEEDVRCP
jgi:nitroimidazol reductase NimA-like FMN-containing flavoprotein (pyridoxamine 5'-phosphate oxidase superfamily)